VIEWFEAFAKSIPKGEFWQSARGCRLMQRSKFDSYQGYTDRDSSLLGEAAPDPFQPSRMV
jgi:hypothetical protein